MSDDRRYVSYRELTEPGQIIAKRRTELQLSQTEVARKLRYRNPNFISMLEKGNGTPLLPVNRALEFAEVLEMDKAWFLEMVLRSQYPKVAEYLFNKKTLESLLEGRPDSELPVVVPGEGALNARDAA